MYVSSNSCILPLKYRIKKSDHINLNIGFCGYVKARCGVGLRPVMGGSMTGRTRSKSRRSFSTTGTTPTPSTRRSGTSGFPRRTPSGPPCPPRRGDPHKACMGSTRMEHGSTTSSFNMQMARTSSLAKLRPTANTPPLTIFVRR